MLDSIKGSFFELSLNRMEVERFRDHSYNFTVCTASESKTLIDSSVRAPKH